MTFLLEMLVISAGYTICDKSKPLYMISSRCLIFIRSKLCSLLLFLRGSGVMARGKFNREYRDGFPMKFHKNSVVHNIYLDGIKVKSPCRINKKLDYTCTHSDANGFYIRCKKYLKKINIFICAIRQLSKAVNDTKGF